MVVDDEYPDFLHSHPHFFQFNCFGHNASVTVVPWPGQESTVHFAPTRDARSFMIFKPTCPPLADTLPGSKPAPLSLTVIMVFSALRSTPILTWDAWACFRIFDSDS